LTRGLQGQTERQSFFPVSHALSQSLAVTSVSHLFIFVLWIHLHLLHSIWIILVYHHSQLGM
jgi:hypothetical protein